MIDHDPRPCSVGPVGGHSNRDWCKTHQTYADKPQTGRCNLRDNHHAEPVGTPSVCRVCDRPTRQWPDGRFPIHASV